MKDYSSYKGQKFGMLTFTGKTERRGDKRKRAWGEFVCDCGKEHIARMDVVLNGDTQSCGCVYHKIHQRNGRKNIRKAIEAQIKYNDYKVNGNTVTVYMFNSPEVMLCDLEDWERLKSHCWYVADGYACAHVKGTDKTIQFHQKVIDVADGNVRDHINRNRLDNRKSNLREASYLLNAINFTIKRHNTSGVTGVSFDRSIGKWRARIRCNNKRYYLGSYHNKKDAIKARKLAEEKLFKPILEAE